MRTRRPCAKATQDIVDRFGRIDVLVNCSLVARAELLSATRDEDLERTFSNCTVESFAWMRECRPHLAAVHGSIINLGSRMAMQGQPGLGMLAARGRGACPVSAVLPHGNGSTMALPSTSFALGRRPRSSSVGHVSFPMRRMRRFRLWDAIRSPRHMIVSWIRASFSRMRRDIMSRARCSRHRRFEGLIA